jgi:hypothetical protein
VDFDAGSGCSHWQLRPMREKLNHRPERPRR